MGALKLSYYNDQEALEENQFSFLRVLGKNNPASKNCFSSYRYSFQGQEKDDEIKGEGNSINFKFRMHDARIVRFFSVDPLTEKYPHYSPYSFSGNKLIHMVELEGAEELPFQMLYPGQGLRGGSVFQSSTLSKTYGGAGVGANFNYQTSYRPRSHAFTFNAASNVDFYGRKNNVWAAGIGSQSKVSIGYKHNRKVSKRGWGNTLDRSVINKGFSAFLSVEAHFDLGVLHPISTITKSFTMNVPLGDHSSFQFLFGNDFAWGGIFNFGYNAHHKKFGGSADGGITQHMGAAVWWKDASQGIAFQAWGTTAHRINGTDTPTGFALSDESRKGRQLYATENTKGSYFGIGKFTYYNTGMFGLNGTLGLSLGIEGQNMGAGLQDWIHLQPAFSPPNPVSYLFGWDTNDRARPTVGISYSFYLNRPETGSNIRR